MRELAGELAERIQNAGWDPNHHSIGAQALLLRTNTTNLMDQLLKLVQRPDYGSCVSVLGWERMTGRTRAQVVDLLRDVARGVE